MIDWDYLIEIVWRTLFALSVVVLVIVTVTIVGDLLGVGGAP